LDNATKNISSNLQPNVKYISGNTTKQNQQLKIALLMCGIKK